MKTIFILMDTLNRRYLNIYGNDWVDTPNINRLAKKSIIFDNHWVGSAPCMPARRDVMTGRLNFMERNWGPIEPFDVTLPEILRREKVFTHMVTDHYHYFEIGGENYCQLFNTWEFYRGQEDDPWISIVEEYEWPQKYGVGRKQYGLNSSTFRTDKDYPSPKTFQAAAKWLENNHDVDDFLLWVEAFDPHEPFDCPSEFSSIYGDNTDDLKYKWPKYNWHEGEEATEASGKVEKLRNQYAATLTMNDKWLGKLLDVLDNHKLWKDTLIILTTDHGYMLGEHNYTGKNFMHMYNEWSHIPLLVHLPSDYRKGERIDALTQNIDVLPTLLDYCNIAQPVTNLHGSSWRPLIEKTNKKIRDSLIYGCFGKCINITDGKYTYFRAPISEDNSPLYLYSSVPNTLRQFWPREIYPHIECGRFLKHSDIPVYKVPVSDNIDECNISVNMRCLDSKRPSYTSENRLFNIENDYFQLNPLDDKNMEHKLCQKLVETMKKHDAPVEQYERLGLNNL